MKNLYEFRVRRYRRACEAPASGIRGPADIAQWLAVHADGLDREHFYCIHLDIAGQVLGYELIAIGSVASVDVHPREVFRSAIIAGSFAIVVAHNHPSGNLEHSAEDLALVHRLKAAGDLLGIEVLDSIVLGHGMFQSLAESVR